MRPVAVFARVHACGGREAIHRLIPAGERGAGGQLRGPQHMMWEATKQRAALEVENGCPVAENFDPY